jgi:hypothetical protein
VTQGETTTPAGNIAKDYAPVVDRMAPQSGESCFARSTQTPPGRGAGNRGRLYDTPTRSLWRTAPEQITGRPWGNPKPLLSQTRGWASLASSTSG